MSKNNKPKFYQDRDLNSNVPLELYISDGAGLQFQAYCSVADVELIFRMQYLSVNGDVIQSEFSLEPTSDRILTTRTIPITEGWLIGASLQVGSGTVNVGQCFAIINLMNTTTNLATKYRTIIQGYVTTSNNLSYPGDQVQNSADGPGNFVTEELPNPGANTNVIFTVATNQRVRIIAFQYQLENLEVVANQNPGYVVTNAGFQAVISYANFTIVPTANTLVIFFNGCTEPHAAINIESYLVSNLVLNNGDTIRSDVIGGGPSFQITNARIYYEEWIMEP